MRKINRILSLFLCLIIALVAASFSFAQDQIQEGKSTTGINE